MFKKSSNLMNRLEERLSSSNKKVLKFKIDSKIRWNSLYEMLERFLYLHKDALLIISDIDPDLMLSNEEIDLTSKLV